MAIYEGPFASGMRGKLGNVVGAKTVGGRTALRAYKEHVKNPNTARQQVSRAKMQQASALAAMFAEAIGIGYAKAVQGMKMYARNLFVSEVIPQGNGYFTVSGSTVTRSDKNLPLSRANGLTVVPTVALNEEQGVGYKAVVSGYSGITLNPGEKLGIIVCAYNEANGLVDVEKAVAGSSDETEVVINPAIFSEVAPTKLCAFFKVIPAAVNGVATETIPWKYPSATGDCAYATI